MYQGRLYFYFQSDAKGKMDANQTVNYQIAEKNWPWQVNSSQWKPYCFNTNMLTRTCTNKCDDTGECGSPAGAKCAELVQEFPCEEYYAPGKPYAGWCDEQCGYGTCRSSTAK